LAAYAYVLFTVVRNDSPSFCIYLLLAPANGNAQLMIENVATLILTFSSFLLLAYWFRYACLLILTAKTTYDYAGVVATANRLDFPKVQRKLRSQAVDLDRLKDALDRDYEVLIYLLKNAANAPTGEAAIEKRMLEIYYRLLRVWYQATSRFSPPIACQALSEMSIVLAHFANAMGERVAAPP
jgi:hypothetical protein